MVVDLVRAHAFRCHVEGWKFEIPGLSQTNYLLNLYLSVHNVALSNTGIGQDPDIQVCLFVLCVVI